MLDALSGIVDLERAASVSLYRQLYTQLRDAILNGHLPAGTRIPASRSMAVQLGVARNTVLAALEQLAAEGYLETRQGAGTVVSGQLRRGLMRAARREPDAPPPDYSLSRSADRMAMITRATPDGENPRAFMPGIPDLESFPRDLWARLLRRASHELEDSALAYGGTWGLPRLRAALSDHLREMRGVQADPEQIIVTSSAQGALDLLARAMLDPQDKVWVEDPGYLGARAAFSGTGATLVPVPVDKDGLNPAGNHPRPRLIYVTPSHQYPTGILMPLARRLELLECASRHGAFIIEDDYDSEFQFQGRPVAALQGLDASGRVLYIGTFSKILQPGIRVGYAVVPPALAEPLRSLQRNSGHIAPGVVQLALAKFIEEGHLRAHVRRTCALYEERQDALVSALEENFGTRMRVNRPAGGMQLVAELPPETDDVALARSYGERGIVARPLSQLTLGDHARSGLLMGYAGYPVKDIREAVAACRDIARI
ncbi:MAG: PLP-dependent aminotransferase family protein [Hyphomicrobiaceae bacterium]|nr:PLP-dependent aminotransferase family protein [Hyphomicrobiaceae bacterium]